MHSIVFLLLTFFITMPALAQTPNKQQMQGQMKEVVNELNKKIAELEKQITEARIKEENAESISQKEEQLAMLKKQVTMMGGLNKGISNMSEKTFQQAVELEENKDGIPKKDSKRINMLPDGILTTAQLAVFVKKIHSEVERLLPIEDKNEAVKFYTALKSKKASIDAISSIASICWLRGYPEMALYILGEECMASLSDGNNLNNYAAFLLMRDGEHAALPILQYLNKKYSNNSTILNNIGQAWYGLGDMNNAKKFLDSAIKLYPRHSQANITKSKIQQAEGKTQEAIESIRRSIQENYTPEKEAMLVKLGGKLEYGDVLFRYKMKPEPLGFEKFILTIPEYIMDGGMAAANNEMEWNDFHEKVAAAENKISDQINVLEPIAEAYNIRFLANPMIIMPYSNTVYRTAKRKLDLLFEWVSDRLPRLDKKMKEAKDSVNKWADECNAAIIAHKVYNNTRGIPGDCGVLKSFATAFNIKANTLWQQRNSELLSFNKQFLNTWANLALYTATDKSQYDLWIAHIKKSFLGTLRTLHHESTTGCMPETPEEQHGKILPDFDSMNCDYKDEIKIPPFLSPVYTTIQTECNIMKTEVVIEPDLGLVVGAKLKIGGEENLNTGKYTKGTAEIGVDKSIGSKELGPLKAEAKLEGKLGIEVTSGGGKEVYIKAGASAELGLDLDPVIIPAQTPSATASLETKISWNAGPTGKAGSFQSTLTGQASLQNINLSSSKSN